MKTFTPTPKDIQRDWFVVDASNKTLGRLASQIAHRLRGKHKPEFAPHMDNGDFIVVVNCEKVRVTGTKLDNKKYWRHTGYPGGIYSNTLRELLDNKPDQVLEKAVKGMLPHTKLGNQIYRKLSVYAGPEHPHQAQKPEVLELNIR